jgi:hypothetical protein
MRYGAHHDWSIMGKLYREAEMNLKLMGLRDMLSLDIYPKCNKVIEGLSL